MQRPLVSQSLLRRVFVSPTRSFMTTRGAYPGLTADGASPQFWLEFAQKGSGLEWVKPPQTAITPHASVPGWQQWFPDGVLNVSANCLDVHVAAGRGDKVAIVYESTVSDSLGRNITYAELLEEVERTAGGLAALGVGKGDRVLIYMPMIPEAVTTMLACARLGAVHVVVFGGFSAPELEARVAHTQPKAIVTASGGMERGKSIPYPPMLNEALAACPHRPAAVVVKHRPEVGDVPAVEHPNVVDFADMVATSEPHPPVAVGCTDSLYVLHTSGTTGDPKGILRDNTHPVALKYAMYNFMKADETSVYFSASDIGWVVGHSYIVFSPLLVGCTTVLYEGKPIEPDAGQFWRLVEKHKVTHIFTAPTALRAVRKLDPSLAMRREFDISTLRHIFLAGERADPATVSAYMTGLGLENNIVDSFWQTETGWPILGMRFEDVGVKAGCAGLPLPGYNVVVLDEDGNELPRNTMGALAVKLPLPPGVMSTLYDNDERFVSAYLSQFPGYFALGDAGIVDDDGEVSVLTRLDDVINCAGHRLSSGQLEEAVLHSAGVAEAAVVAMEDELKGHIPLAFVVLREGVDMAPDDVAADVVQQVRHHVGAVASLRDVVVIPGLPKTRSGKNLRRVLADLVNGNPVKLPGTIEDVSVVDTVREVLASVGLPRSKS